VCDAEPGDILSIVAGAIVSPVSTTATDWTTHTRQVLAESGHRASAPRAQVIDAIADLGCSVNAREIADLLRDRDSNVGVASIYRALELLERMGLVKRFDLGEGAARYEPASPGGDHHHHIVCDSCGKVEPFEDDALEKAIHRLSDRADFSIAAHDVTLHGECPACAAAG
jgi:Fur family ferric uptake transcriptional regulator